MGEDDWLRDRARKRKQELLEQRRQNETIWADQQRRKDIFDVHIDELWAQLQTEFRRQVDIYNDEVGEQDLFLECHPDEIRVEYRQEGVRAKIELSRPNQTLTETNNRNRSRAIDLDTSTDGGFAYADGQLAFADGSPQQKAAKVLRGLVG